MIDDNYKLTNKNEFIEEWQKIKWNDNKTFNLYVANPFCLKKCKFCIYNSVIEKINSNCYKSYYDNFLINEIEGFKNILNNKTPDTVYFGGGTASFMTTKTMKNV